MYSCSTCDYESQTTTNTHPCPLCTKRTCSDCVYHVRLQSDLSTTVFICDSCARRNTVAIVKRPSYLKRNMTAAIFEAALQGHDLDEWVEVDDWHGGWQAECKNCGMTTYVSDGARYSILGENCSQEPQNKH